jgi:transposase
MTSQEEGVRPVEDWAEIRRLHRVEGLSQRAIARRLGLARDTVAAALKRNEPPRYRRAPRGSKLDPYKPRIVELLERYPALSGVRVYEILHADGYRGKLSILRDYLATQRPRPAAYQRTEYAPGEIGQVDWLELPERVPDPFGEPRRTYALLLVLGYSRYLTAGFSFGLALPDLLRCLAEGLAFFGGVPRRLVFDNPKTVVLRHRGREIAWNPGFMTVADRYGFRPHVCTPGPIGAHEKGLVERPVGYFKGNFCAGRQFESLEDLTGQFTRWRDTVANVRLHATLRQRPADRFVVDQAALLPLPVEPHDGIELRPARVSRQGLVRVETSDYSVPAVLAGHLVEVHLGVTTVQIVADGRVVAEHPRSLGRYRLVEDPAHRAQPWATGRSVRPDGQALGHLPPAAQVTVEEPDLSRYAALVEA